MERSDKPALLRITIQLTLFSGLLCMLALIDLPAFALPPLLFLLGFVIFSLYAPLHECTHQSAFLSPKLNRNFAWITGILFGYSPGTYAAFHSEHHLHTNGERDPERSFRVPDMPGKTIMQLLLNAVGLMLLPLHSLILSLVPVSNWKKTSAPWALGYNPQSLQRESRIVALVWLIVLTALAFLNLQLLLYLLIGICMARLLQAAVTFAEHEGLGPGNSSLYVGRTTFSHPLFRWFWWNMNYHAEHHTWPEVPFHQLPKLHKIAATRINSEKSYLQFFLHGHYQKPILTQAGIQRGGPFQDVQTGT